MGIDNADKVANKIYSMTNGWPFGSVALLRSYKSNGRVDLNYVFPFIVEEIFEGKEEYIKEFMVKTSLMPILNPAAIDKFLGIKNSKAILESLYEKGIPIQKFGENYIYHDLFKKFLKNRLPFYANESDLSEQLANTYVSIGERVLALNLYAEHHDLQSINEVLKRFSDSEIIKYADSVLSATERAGLAQLKEFPAAFIARVKALYAKGEQEKAVALVNSADIPENSDFFVPYALIRIKIYNSVGKYLEALGIFESSIKKRIKKLHRAQQIEFFYEVARSCFYSGDEKRAEEVLTELYKSIDTVRDPRLKIKIMHAYCIVMLHDKGLYGEAKEVYKQIVAVSEENGLIVDPMILTNLSYCENDLGFKENAEKYVKKAITIAKDLEWEPRIRSSEIAYGHYLLTVNEFGKAINIFKNHIEEEDPYLRSSALFGMAEALRKTRNFKEAEFYEIEDLRIAEKTKNKMMLAQSYFQEGLIKFGLGENQKAESFFRKAFAFAKESGNIYEIARSSIVLAAFSAIQRKSYKEYFDLAKEIIEKEKFYYIVRSEWQILYPFLTGMKEKSLLEKAVSLFGGADLMLRTFGGFYVFCMGINVTKEIFKREKARKIFQFVLSMHPKPVSYDLIADTFFAEMPFDRAKHNIRVLLSEINRAFENTCGAGILQRTPEGYIAALSSNNTDFLRFEALFEEATEKNDKPLMKAAVRIYKGDFLPECLYEDWSAVKREHYFMRYIELLFKLSESSSGKERVRYLLKILENDPFNEEAAYLLMKTYVELGKGKNASEFFKMFRKKFLYEYEMEPDRKLTDFYEKIKRFT